MNKSEATSKIKAMVLGLEYGMERSKMQLLRKAKKEEDTINLSVLVRIRQKDNYDDNIFLLLIKIDDQELNTLEIASLALDPESRTNSIDGSFPTPESGMRLEEDEYFVVQNIRYNLKNIPLCGVGSYALALVAEKDDLESLIDAYYFTVE